MDIKQNHRGPLERPMRFYINAMIQKPVPKPGKESAEGVWDEIFAKMVVRNLLDHVELSPSVAAANASLAEMYMVLYYWGETGARVHLYIDPWTGDEMVGTVNRDNVTTQALKKIATLSKDELEMVKVKGSNVEDFSDLVQVYLSQHWGNVQMVGREGLEKWLLPTLLPFPHIFMGMGIGLDPDAE
jgi:hypothetical protein